MIENLDKSEHYTSKHSKPFLGQKFAFWLIFIAAFAFTLGFIAGQRNIGISPQKAINLRLANTDKPADVTVDFAPFWQVWKVINERYLDKSSIDHQKLLYGAISGMVNSIGDPYTAFLPPADNKTVKEELGGSYEGVGIQLGFREKKLVVIAPLSQTPAEKAGVRAGDQILKIDNTETEGLSLPEAVRQIRGVQGTSVTLLIIQNGENEGKEFKITREKIQIKSVEVKFENTPKGEIATIKLIRFGEQTNDEWTSAVDQIITHSAKGVILDVRNNPGGFLQGAVFIGSEFVDGKIVGQESANGDREFLNSQRRGKLLKIPLVAVVNKGSASAAEIVAGAMQDHKRAKLVGETTFGKGSIQDAQDFPDGSGIHVTIAKWLLPSGRNINDVGITPDVEVKLSKEDAQAGKDPQFDKAKELLLSQIK